MTDMTALADPQLYRLVTILCQRRVRHWHDGRRGLVRGSQRRRGDQRAETIVADLVQTAFLYAIKAWDKYDPEKGKLSTWLAWCLKCAVSHEQQRRGTDRDRSITYECDLADGVLDSHACVARQDDIVYAKEALAAHQKVARHKQNQTRARKRRTDEFEKRLLGYSFEELAQAHGLSRQMVEVDVYRHRQELLERLA